MYNINSKCKRINNMEIKKASILVAGRDRRTKRMIGLDGCVIEFTTNDNIAIGTKLLVIFEEKEHYFNVKEVEVTDDGDLLIRASEVGYFVNHMKRKAGFDPRSLINLPISIVTDSDRLKYISEASCWC